MVLAENSYEELMKKYRIKGEHRSQSVRHYENPQPTSQDQTRGRRRRAAIVATDSHIITIHMRGGGDVRNKSITHLMSIDVLRGGIGIVHGKSRRLQRSRVR